MRRNAITPPRRISKRRLKGAGVPEHDLSRPDCLKREQVSFIEAAKKEETKQTRQNKLIARLGGEK
jgi:hypothetical protein